MKWRPLSSAALGVAMVFCVASVSSRAGRAQEPALPDKAAFLEETKKRLRDHDRIEEQYTYRERQTREDFDNDGRVRKRVVKEFEIYPSIDGSPSYRRLVATDGVPEPPGRLREADRKHREKLQDWLQNREEESPDEREDREARERQREARLVDDIARVYEIALLRREVVRGRPAIVLSLTPRPGVRPTSDRAAPMTKLAGRAWVDEEDFEVARVELESTDTISFGWGLFARVGAGTTLAFERQKVDGEAWLPARMEMRPRARIALVKRVDAHIIREFGEYRKLTPETSLGLAAVRRE